MIVETVSSTEGYTEALYYIDGIICSTNEVVCTDKMLILFNHIYDAKTHIDNYYNILWETFSNINEEYMNSQYTFFYNAYIGDETKIKEIINKTTPDISIVLGLNIGI